MLERTAKELTSILNVTDVMKSHIATVLEPKNEKWRNGTLPLANAMSESQAVGTDTFCCNRTLSMAPPVSKTARPGTF